MYIYIYTYIHTYMHTYIYIYIYTYIHTYIHERGMREARLTSELCIETMLDIFTSVHQRDQIQRTLKALRARASQGSLDG